MTPIAPPINISRHEFDAVIIRSFRAIYKFEQANVQRFALNYDGIFLLQFLRSQSPSTMGAIAQEMQIPVSTATRMVDRLVAKGLVSRKKAPKDKRIMLVSLEPGGEELLKAVEDGSFDTITQNLTRFTEAEIKMFFETARSMEKILEIPESP
ncbi:MAG: MarR family transcriptional regulator [Proteobacteria bacterium]|nr:MarR family transcriptional regulator [Desulfobacula sp.]MBU3953194.1 MarR family transcriptional regulator [Pseudomonadota bacterium]MBU4133438.1 MarR family transcriptional regulator [Pseudomonadota bacterium]